MSGADAADVTNFSKKINHDPLHITLDRGELAMNTSLLISLALIGLSGGPLFAANMVLRGAQPLPVAPVAPVTPVSSWTGCYVGANAGWALTETSVSFNGVTDFSRSHTGGAFGGQIGCDYQFAN